MINRNKLAQYVAKMEGGKVETNIAQIKEVQRWVLCGLSRYSDAEVLALLKKVRKEQAKRDEAVAGGKK